MVICTANRVGTILLNLCKIYLRFKTENQFFSFFKRKMVLGLPVLKLCLIIRQGNQIIAYHLLNYFL